ncbi:MAG: hypothetical protein EPO28_08860 [Saprospiraceae bacterium]|nr:MAG: hypothetical protein EPO28_08860 [Saprospiraceae bacterium]
MNKVEVIKKLEDYLDGNLSATESSDLECQLAADAALFSELRLLKELRAMLAGESADEKLREKLEDAYHTLFKKNKLP